MSPLAELMRLAKKGPFRAADAGAVGIPRVYLSRWVEGGLIERVGRGLYRLVSAPASELASIAEVARRAPRANVCLLSALEIHGLTSESPGAVWLMIEGHGRIPRIDFVSTEAVRASGAAFHHGVQERTIEGTRVRITSPAKTVADCFRYRRHAGLEVALESLRDYMRRAHERRGREYSIPVLTEAMVADRVTSVMCPYVEALL